MIKFVYSHFKTFLIIFSLFSLTSVTAIWWLSIFSIFFFAWNLFNKKVEKRICTMFLVLTILLNILNFSVLKPISKWGDKVQTDWNKTGYDSIWLVNAQESINVIYRSIERFKVNYHNYPNSLEDITEIFIDNHDYSYRISKIDGQTNGVPFYYEKIDSNKFYLSGVGKDGIIKTNDDLLPQISQAEEKKTGLVKYVIKSFTPEELDREKKVLVMLKIVKALMNSNEKH